jgi:hypothetical protein
MAIALVNVEWGPIGVNAPQATATTWETWTTTYDDGTTDESRDRNVYTLVLSGDSWLIASDSHPDATPSAAASPGDVPPPSALPAPTAAPGASMSRNWAGYAATGGQFTGVSAIWAVPPFAPSLASGVDATWVGIGGMSSRDLIQAGTQEITSGGGTTEYQAWVEALPRPSLTVPLYVYAGDQISVSVIQQSPGLWQISFANGTTGQTYQVTQQYESSLSSAEWVVEAPTASRGRLLPLDDFGTISMNLANAMVNGETVSAGDAGAQPIALMGRHGEVLAQPGLLSPDGASFAVSTR